MPHWLYLGYLGFIPITWWTTNKVRAKCSQWAVKRRYRNNKRRNEADMSESASVRALPEVQTYCAGCDQIVPESWMAWLDADCDGDIGELYRCSVCRGVLDLDPVASQKAANERMAAHFSPNGHDAECQCSNCEPAQNGWDIGSGLIVSIDDMHQATIQRYQEMTEEQVENARRPLDLSQLLAPEYTAAVEDYRAAGIDATNETDRLYRERIAKRAQRRQAELRAKYHMDTGEWRNNVKRNGHWEWTGMGKEWVND